MAISKANFSHVTSFENEGVDLTFFSVDFINAMNAETGDPDTSSSTAGLELVRRTIEQFCNILGEGALTNSNTEKTYFVRADTAPTAATLQAAIRAVNSSSSVSATISSATVTAKALTIAV